MHQSYSFYTTLIVSLCIFLFWRSQRKPSFTQYCLELLIFITASLSQQLSRSGPNPVSSAGGDGRVWRCRPARRTARSSMLLGPSAVRSVVITGFTLWRVREFPLPWLGRLTGNFPLLTHKWVLDLFAPCHSLSCNCRFSPWSVLGSSVVSLHLSF